MPPEPIKENAINLDLSQRYFSSIAVVASPAAAVETIIATVTISANAAIMTGVQLWGWAALTVGTDGVSARLRIRRTDASGSTRVDTGALTATAATLIGIPCQTIDAGATLPGQVYVLTLTVGSASAASTVSAVQLCGLIV